MRQRVAFEAQRSSWDEVVSAVDRDSGAHVPKRQAQQMAKRAAQDLEVFYQQSAGPDNDVLSPTALEVASCDSKGVTMLKKGLREATRKAAEQAQTQTNRTDPMAPKKQRKHDKRMAIVTANWEQERQPHTAEQILANLDRQPGAKKPRGPRPQKKRVCASMAIPVRSIVDSGVQEGTWVTLQPGDIGDTCPTDMGDTLPLHRAPPTFERAPGDAQRSISWRTT